MCDNLVKIKSAKCIFCGSKLKHLDTQMYSDFLGEDLEKDSMVYYLICPKCKAKYDIFEHNNNDIDE